MKLGEEYQDFLECSDAEDIEIKLPKGTNFEELTYLSVFSHEKVPILNKLFLISHLGTREISWSA